VNLLLVTPPLTQLNTTYPATPFLTGFLRARGIAVSQIDASLEWVLRLFSREGIARIADALRPRRHPSPAVRHFLRHLPAIEAQIEPVIQFLQGRDPSLAHRIASRRYLVEGSRFASIGPEGEEESYLDWAFGTLGVHDRARYFATLFLEDIADCVRDGIDPSFDFSRYGERLASSQPTLDPLLEELGRDDRLTAQVLAELTRDLYEVHQPTVVGMTLPFPGNVLGALRMAKTFKALAPDLKVVWGGGYVNTELRELRDPRLFRFVDAVTYDDGERPLSNLLEHFEGRRPKERLCRTRLLVDGEVRLLSAPEERDFPFGETGCPTYDGLPLDRYLSLLDSPNPMHRLWSDTRWNKLTVAHGCYWRKCTFCDTTLDYIRRYKPLEAKLLVDRIEALLSETGTRGFHFVDEAAPPATLQAMAQEILRRNLQIAWWTNIRFERAFTPTLCDLLRRSGCIAVTGGLEAAHNRLLALLHKGLTVEQAARVTHAFSAAGIRVHAYLMFGCPTETEQETMDSLEVVRQLFVHGCLESAYWHRFSATAHAPIGLHPEQFGIRLLREPRASFARNDLPFEDPTGCDHERLGRGLRKAVYNYMRGLGLEEDVRVWFEGKVPKPTVPPGYIRRAVDSLDPRAQKATKPPRRTRLE
jgi:radical SAM superfamily enzyme YgiQ (UPF0313 family)